MQLAQEELIREMFWSRIPGLLGRVSLHGKGGAPTSSWAGQAAASRGSWAFRGERAEPGVGVGSETRLWTLSAQTWGIYSSFLFLAVPEGSLVMDSTHPQQEMRTSPSVSLLCARRPLVKKNFTLFEGPPPPLGKHNPQSFQFCCHYTSFLPIICWHTKPQVF